MGWTFAQIAKFLTSTCGVYASFLIWGVLQEKITSEGYLDEEGNKHKFKQVAAMNVVQALVGMLIGYLGLLFDKPNPDAPLSAYRTIGFTTAAASPIGYQALAFIDYPLFALGKSCKIIPVMLWSMILNKTRYTISEYISVLLITIGVALFSVKLGAEFSKGLASTLFGLVIVFVNLGVDGYTCAQQDKMTAQSRRPVSAFQSLCYLNFWIIVVLVLFLSLDHLVYGSVVQIINPTGPIHVSTLTLALAFYNKFPQVLFDIILFSICGSVGQLAILYNIREFGSLVNTIVTVTRKFLTIIISVVYYSHPMTPLKWAGTVFVFTGLASEAYRSYKKKHK